MRDSGGTQRQTLHEILGEHQIQGPIHHDADAIGPHLLRDAPPTGTPFGRAFVELFRQRTPDAGPVRLFTLEKSVKKISQR